MILYETMTFNSADETAFRDVIREIVRQSIYYPPFLLRFHHLRYKMPLSSPGRNTTKLKQTFK